MPEAGLEPAHTLGTRDFKSFAIGSWLYQRIQKVIEFINQNGPMTMFYKLAYLQYIPASLSNSGNKLVTFLIPRNSHV